MINQASISPAKTFWLRCGQIALLVGTCHLQSFLGISKNWLDRGIKSQYKKNEVSKEYSELINAPVTFHNPEYL